MSVVIAIKEKDTVWVATDSQASLAGTKMTLTSQNCLKIWRPTGHEDMVMGLVGAMRDNNILSTVDYWIDEATELKDEFNFKTVVRDTVPKIFSQLREFGSLMIQDGGVEVMQSAMILAYKDKAFQICEDGCVIEAPSEGDIMAIGSGFKHCLSAYDAIKDIDGLTIREKLIKTVAAACHADLYVQYPIIITNTKMDTFEVFDGTSLIDGYTNEEIDMDGNSIVELTEEEIAGITKICEDMVKKQFPDREPSEDEMREIESAACRLYFGEEEEDV